MTESTHYLKDALAEPDKKTTGRIIDTGLHEIGVEINELVNRHLRDLPMLVACLKQTMPSLERMLGPAGRGLAQEIGENMVTMCYAAPNQQEGND